MLGILVIVTFAPASRDLASTWGSAEPTPTTPAAASLAPLPAAPDGGTAPEEPVLIQRAWDTGPLVAPALISWWDAERWTEREEEQERWRREWLAEARRNPGNVPVELWPKIVAWAPDERRLASSARAVLGDDRLLRRYASRTRGRDWVTPWDRPGSDAEVRIERERTESRLRRWARDALRNLRDRADRADRERANRERANRGRSKRPQG